MIGVCNLQSFIGSMTQTLILSYISHESPKSTLFPYTTLFRSRACCGPTLLGRTARDSPPLWPSRPTHIDTRSEEHTSELQSLTNIVCRLLLKQKSFIASMTQKLTLSDISDESNNYLDKAGITT